MMNPGTFTCSGCGQSTDHPKVYYNTERYHYDCLPKDVKEDVFSGLDEDRAAKMTDVIEKADSGTHGEDLRTYIVETFAEGES